MQAMKGSISVTRVPFAMWARWLALLFYAQPGTSTSGKRSTTEILDCSNASCLRTIFQSPLDEQSLSSTSEHERHTKAHLEDFPLAWCPRASPPAVLQEASGFGHSIHVKIVGIMRVCGSAKVFFHKLSLSCACLKVIPDSTSLDMGGKWITARSTHEENATASSGAFPIGSTFVPHCIALAPMQLIDMEYRFNGTTVLESYRHLSYAACFLLVANPLHRCPCLGRKSHRRQINQ